jgi:hypothetical protein
LQAGVSNHGSENKNYQHEKPLPAFFKKCLLYIYGMNPSIKVEPIFHNKSERILLRYAYNNAINNLVKNLPGVKWSQTHKAWHLPLNEAAFKIAVEQLRPVAELDIGLLSTYLQKRKRVQQTQLTEKPAELTPKQIAVYSTISTHNLAELERRMDTRKLKVYGESSR